MDYYGLVGARSHGRETMPLLRARLQAAGDPATMACFVVEEGIEEAEEVDGVPVLRFGEFDALVGDKHFTVTLSDAKLRRTLAQRGLAAGWQAMSVFALNAVTYDTAIVGPGAILSSFSMVSANAVLGKFAQVNAYASVMHDCVIGDYVTLSPGARCNGNVHIGDGAFIGSGAVIRDGKPGAPLIIGEGAVVGMGAVVVKDVAPHTTVVGNPARAIR